MGPVELVPDVVLLTNQVAKFQPLHCTLSGVHLTADVVTHSPNNHQSTSTHQLYLALAPPPSSRHRAWREGLLDQKGRKSVTGALALLCLGSCLVGTHSAAAVFGGQVVRRGGTQIYRELWSGTMYGYFCVFVYLYLYIYV